MNKQNILEEIRRTAFENGGRPLARPAFSRETGIRLLPAKYWTEWQEALVEAGFAPDEYRSNRDEDFGRVCPGGIDAGKAQGSVFLLRSGHCYKIAHQDVDAPAPFLLPYGVVLEHEIITDDPQGIESYWLRRFQAKPKKEDWLLLDFASVAAFKSRHSM